MDEAAEYLIKISVVDNKLKLLSEEEWLKFQPVFDKIYDEWGTLEEDTLALWILKAVSLVISVEALCTLLKLNERMEKMNEKLEEFTK